MDETGLTEQALIRFCNVRVPTWVAKQVTRKYTQMEHGSQMKHENEQMGHARALFDFSRRNDGYPETKNKQVIFEHLTRIETGGKSEKQFNEPFYNSVYGCTWHPAVTVNQHVHSNRAPMHQIVFLRALNRYHGYEMKGNVLHHYPHNLGNTPEFIEGLSETLLCFIARRRWDSAWLIQQAASKQAKGECLQI